MRPFYTSLTLIGFSALLAGAGPASALQLGARPAEDWALVLESGRRMEALEIERVVSLLDLEPGAVVADIGAGTGIFSVPLARSVGPTGTVYSVEVDEGFLPMIEERAAVAGLQNVQTVLGVFDNPRLPSREIDVAFFHDVLHHIEERELYILTLATYMGPDARIVVVDYDMNVPGVPHSNDPTMLISPDQVADWMSAAGFSVEREIDIFEDKFFVVYSAN